jgi:type IV pilus assembly protein PilA
MRTNKGFSLVELMIVVAIIGILAAIAIPNFMTMQLKAKRGELPSNVNGIKTAELAYDAMYDGFVAAATNGAASPGKTAVLWTTGVAGWTELPWSPDGEVRGNYAVVLAGTNDFGITANCDVDADGIPATYTASATLGSTQTSANDAF